jgi:hypothetical protein
MTVINITTDAGAFLVELDPSYSDQVASALGMAHDVQSNLDDILNILDKAELARYVLADVVLSANVALRDLNDSETGLSSSWGSTEPCCSWCYAPSSLFASSAASSSPCTPCHSIEPSIHSTLTFLRYRPHRRTATSGMRGCYSSSSSSPSRSALCSAPS